MSQFSAEIRRTHDWWNLFHTENFRTSWSEIALKHVWIVRTPSSHAEVQLTKRQVRYTSS